MLVGLQADALAFAQALDALPLAHGHAAHLVLLALHLLAVGHHILAHRGHRGAQGAQRGTGCTGGRVVQWGSSLVLSYQ